MPTNVTTILAYQFVLNCTTRRFIRSHQNKISRDVKTRKNTKKFVLRNQVQKITFKNCGPNFIDLRQAVKIVMKKY